MTLAPPRTHLTPVQVRLVRASAELRAVVDTIELEAEGRVLNEGEQWLVRLLRRVQEELWELADEV